MTQRRRLYCGAFVGVLVGAGLANAAPPTTQPTTVPVVSTPTNIAGTTSCRACHERFYQLWATSHHGLAMQPYTDAFATANLTPADADVVIGDRHYRPAVAKGEGWILARAGDMADGSKDPNGATRLSIAHVMGGKNVYYFLTPAARGRWQTLPIAYDVRTRTWFDTASSALRHFPTGSPDAPVDWTDRAYTFNTSCGGCHVSQLATSYDLATDSYHTTWTEPGINCETCHGSAAAHVAACRAADPHQPPADLAITVVTESHGATADRVNDSCAGCHAKMSPITKAYVPGESYFDHYDLAALEDPDFYPDGRDLGENYTFTTWRLNPCAQAGQLDCLHCHTSSGRFRFAAQPNDACLPCHADRVADVATHTHHAADSTGSQCMACHLPQTEFARMRRSDHSCLPPTPAVTLEFQSPNACNLCHTDKDAKWANAAVREWYADDYQAPILTRARLIAAARARDWSQLPAILQYIARPDREEIFAAGLLRLLGACDDAAKWPAVTAALGDPSPLVRAAAAQTLASYVTPASLPALIRATRDDVRLVRIRAAAALAGVPEAAVAPTDRAAVRAATTEYLASTQVRPDDAIAHYNRGNYFLAAGDYAAARASFTTALQLRPDDVPARVNLAVACNALGDNAAAEAALRAAVASAPNLAALHLNLGLLLVERNRPAEAEAALRRAFTLDTNCAAAAYNLGILLAPDRPAEALDWCRRAVTLAPRNVKYVYTLAYYLAATEQPRAAITVLEALRDAGVNDPSCAALLDQLRTNADTAAPAASQ